jgi:DNA-binding transcriptional regulator GbsR (MarR family)
MTEKMTYVKALEFAMSQLDSTVSKEVTDKLEALKAQLEKRAQYKSKSGKMTKAQREAADFREKVVGVLADFGEPVTCGDVAKALGESGQKVSAALSMLGDWRADGKGEGRVERTVGPKKVSLFALKAM